MTITDQQSHTHYKVGTTYQAATPTITETLGSSINLTSVNWTFSGGDGNYYTPSDHYSTSNTLTLTRSTTKTASNQTFTITASAKYGSIDKEGTASVTIPLTYTDLTDIYAGEAVNVSINEYLEIAKMYGGPASPRYINATLDSIVKKLQSENKLVKEA